MTSLTPPQTTYDQIERLVQKFHALPARARQAYNEDNTRKDFVLPLFRALEWNIDDAREVAAEEKVSRGYVDFAFRVNGIRRFVLETKRIGEDLTKPEWAQQAIDYAYHKGVTWAVLSDFEALKIFNAEAREANPFQAQFREIGVDEYLSRLDELWWLSRSAMLEGVLDREAEKVFKKMPRTPIAQALFDSLLEWRKQLYKMLREYNRDKLWSPQQIDDAVQRLLDRLIFTRTAEDRLMEDEKLTALAREKRHDELLPALKKRFRELDDVYNSQLFRTDFVDTLELGEPATIASIIEGLERSPKELVRYNFALIDADVLGRVYEQYLGAVVSDESRRGDSRGRPRAEADRATTRVAPTKSKRKAQGIYYTPTFVVKYIVQQTLGRYLEENGYNPAHPVRVLDPACGSGSFLIEAFDVLDQHLARQRGQEHGTYDIQDHARQREVLTQCIYGVDKDAQAVEVARLNLLLKALHLREKLPTLENIRCGDSLISGAPKELEKYFGAEWKERNPFDWRAEFDKVMAEGGFDVIVGNPPYVRPHNLPAETKSFLWEHFPTFVGKSDLYCCFIQRAIDLARPGGLIAFVVSDGWLRLDSFRAIRNYILSHCEILELVDLPDKVFADASVKTGIFVLRKESSSQIRAVQKVRVQELGMSSAAPIPLREIEQNTFEHTHRNVFDLSLSTENRMLKSEMGTNSTRLDELVDIRFGLKTGDDEKFIHKTAKTKQHKPLLRGENVHRYTIEFAGEYVWYVPAKMREHRQTARPGEPERFEQLKILVRDTGGRFECTLDDHKYYVKDVLILTRKQNSRYSLHYITGLLNSKAMRYYYETTFPTLHVQNSELETLPIRRINFADPAEKKQHDEIVARVGEMLELQKEHVEAERGKFRDKIDAHKRRIDAVDAAIDAAVYRLYDLSEEERRVVEGEREEPK